MTANDDIEIMKQDTRGRVRTTREQREAALDQFEASGMTGAAFAAYAGIKYQTFAGWVRKRRLAGRCVPSRRGAPAAFFEVMASAAPGVGTDRAPLVIRFGDGVVAEVRDPEGTALAVALLRAMGGGLPC